MRFVTQATQEAKTKGYTTQSRSKRVEENPGNKKITDSFAAVLLREGLVTQYFCFKSGLLLPTKFSFKDNLIFE